MNVMNQKDKIESKIHRKFSALEQAGLIVSLVVISIFPLFVTLAPGEWPPQLGVLLIDFGYLLVLVGYLLVLTGRNRSQWLVSLVSVISVVGVLAVLWLTLSLTTLRIAW